METTFDFSTHVIPLIIQEINSAKEYVRIAIFQLHNRDVIKALEDKLKEGLRVEILTLPYDSINKDIRPQVEPRMKQLELMGAKIYFDKWNVGDPGRTTTAVGRWYLFHGKFIVTDKSAIALSANLTQEKELDAVVMFRNAKEKTKEFNLKFEQILDLFVTRDDSFDGTIHRRIVDISKAESEKIFELPENVDPKHREHWIRHYPIEMCQPLRSIEERLHLTPFDCRARDLFVKVINDAEKYAYMSTESFTDFDFSNFLVTTAVNRKIDIRVLTQTTSMDFKDRVENMLRDLLAQKIDVRTTDEALHAKLLLTDKVLLVSSINLNKINLGFSQSAKYWRENTESVYICKSPDVLRLAKEKYLEVLSHGYEVGIKLTEKLKNTVYNTLGKTFGLQSSTEARELFAKFILKKQIDVRKTIMKIGKITEKLMGHYHRTKVEKQDIVSALVLYYLSERKRDIDDLKENVSEIDESVNLSAIISGLEFAGFVEKEGTCFKINVEALFSESRNPKKS